MYLERQRAEPEVEATAPDFFRPFLTLTVLLGSVAPRITDLGHTRVPGGGVMSIHAPHL